MGRQGLLEGPLSVAHGIWLDPPEREALARAGVVVAHNPASNLMLGSGILPYAASLAADLPLALGTDSGLPGRFQGFFEHEELRLMVESGLTPMQALVAATGDAAKCIHQAGQIGTITPGAHADLVSFTKDPTRNILATRTIESVWVDGQPVP